MQEIKDLLKGVNKNLGCLIALVMMGMGAFLFILFFPDLLQVIGF